MTRGCAAIRPATHHSGSRSDDAGDVVRYYLDLDSEAPREEVETFYRMQSADPLNTDGDRTWVYPDHVDDLPEADVE